MQTFRFYIPETQIPDTERERVVRMEQEILRQARRHSRRLLGQLLQLPSPWTDTTRTIPVYAQDRTYAEGELPPIRRFKFISPGFFATLGTPLVAGRDLTWTDTYQKLPVALISENLRARVLA